MSIDSQLLNLTGGIKTSGHIKSNFGATIGVGTDAPTGIVEVQHSQPTLVVQQQATSGGSVTSYGKVHAASGTLHIQSGVDATSDSKGDIVLGSVGSGTKHVVVKGATSRVGIGTDAPAYGLDVTPESRFTGNVITSNISANAITLNELSLGVTQGLDNIVNVDNTTSNTIAMSNVDASTSTTTGALTVAGGIGVGGNVHCSNLYASNITMNLVSFAGLQTFEQVVNNGRDLNSNVLIISNATPSTSSTTGALTLTGGGLGVAGNVHVGTAGQIVVSNAAPSTSTTTGALTVAGGLGVTGDVVAAKFKGDGSELTGVGVWTESNSNIYYEANVAIGTPSVTSGARLEVKGPMRVSNLTTDHHTDLICIEKNVDLSTSVKIADGPATQQGPGGAPNYLGASTAVSADGKTLVVGSDISSSNGGVFVYEGSGDSWTFKGRLKISGATSTTNGRTVAISEDGSVIVCSGTEPSGSTTPKTFIYVRSGSNWTGDVANPTATLTGSHIISTEAWQPDCDISKDGNTIVVGSGFDDVNNIYDSGSCAVYVKPSGGWATTSTATRVLYASDGAASDRLGWMTRISGDGNTIVASAEYADVGGTADQGAAYVWVKGSAWSSATQTEAAKLTHSPGVANDRLSYLALDISDDGDTIVARAGYSTSNGLAVYVFMKAGGGWSNMTQSCKITNSDVTSNDYATGVCISGDASKIFIAVTTVTTQGACYVYNRPSGNWNASSTLSSYAFKLRLADTIVGVSFGVRGFNNATDTTGSVFVAGAVNLNSNSGAAFVWKLTETALEIDTSLRLTGGGIHAMGDIHGGCPVYFAADSTSYRYASSGGTVIIFDHVQVGRGGGYDRATGIFTAPLSGVYKFVFYARQEGGTSIYARMQLNGSSQGHGRAYFNASSVMGGCTAMYRLNVGDTVAVKLWNSSSGRITDSFNGFIGQYISSL